VRKGTEEQYLHLYNNVLTEEQKEQVQAGEIWPPEDFAGVLLENADFYVDDNAEQEDEYEDEEEYEL